MPLEFDFLYMYDSDKPGLVKAIEALGEHKKVFMWKRFISVSSTIIIFFAGGGGF
jgi:hypothetical protein